MLILDLGVATTTRSRLDFEHASPLLSSGIRHVSGIVVHPPAYWTKTCSDLVYVVCSLARMPFFFLLGEILVS